MSSKFKVQSSKLWRVIFFCLLLTAFCQLNCSIPNLENPECTQARNQVKKLYSFHLGNDMKPSTENLSLREEYLTDELKQELGKQPETKKDYFTQTDDYPKAFRVGECAVIEPDKKVNLQVVLFWRDDTRSEQKEVNIEAVKQNETWLINKVENKN